MPNIIHARKVLPYSIQSTKPKQILIALSSSPEHTLELNPNAVHVYSNLANPNT